MQLPINKPSKIIAIGINYVEHSQEMDIATTPEPTVFLKPPSAVIWHEQNIVKPAMSERVDYEGELAIVIGKTAKNVSEAEASQYIKGYTIANDVTARDLQKTDSQWARAKGFDTFSPIGPHIETELDPDNLDITTRLNGQIVQQSNTNCMIFNCRQLLAYVSQIMTLNPDDIIITGTPSGIGPMQPGDCVEIEIEGIGVLRNYYNIV